MLLPETKMSRVGKKYQMILLFSTQLQTIQHHIGLTKEHIDKLNERFSAYQQPPGIFVTVS